MKKTIYGDTEIFSHSACHECAHCKENEDGMFFCKYNPDELFEDDEDDSLPAIHITVHHGAYWKTTTTGCDCDDFASEDDSGDYDYEEPCDYDGRYDTIPSVFDNM